MGWLFSRKLQKKVVVAVSVPLTREDLAQFRLRGSNFYFSLKGEMDKWNDYSRTAEGLSRQLQEIRAMGADVIESFSSGDFQRLEGYEIAVLLIHHTPNGTMELADGEMEDSLFVRQFPKGIGIIDLSSCQSGALIAMFRESLPESNILAVNAKTALLLNGFIVRRVFASMAKKRKLGYLDAYLRTLDKLNRYKSEEVQSFPTRENVVYLGDDVNPRP